MSAVTPSGVPLVPEDAFDWAMQDGVLTSPTCAVERVAAGMKAKFESELAKEKATMETKYAKRLENLEKKMEMTGIQDLTKASSVGEVKLTVNQIKAKLKGETVPTVLATMLMAMCAFGGVTVHKANINDLGDADVVTNVTYVSDGIDLSSVTNVAGSVTSNIVTKSYVEGLGVNTGHTDAQVKALAGQKIDEKVTKQFVEGLGIEAQVPEANVRSAVSNVVTKSYVDSLGLDTMITATSVTNISSKVVSNVVTKAYVEDLGIEAGHTDDEIKALAGPVVTNIAPSLASNVVTKSYVEGLNPDVGQHTDDEVKALAGPVVTNIAPSLVSNVVTKSYVEDLGISGGSADMRAVTNLVNELTSDIPRVQINRTFDDGLKIADVSYNGEERNLYIPSEMPAESAKGSSAVSAKRSGGESSFRIRTSGSGSQTYMYPYGSAFFWAKSLDSIWVGGDVADDGTVYGAMRFGTKLVKTIQQNAPPPGNYATVSNNAMTAVQSLQPAYDYTDSSAAVIKSQVLGSVTNNLISIVTNQVLENASRLKDGSKTIEANRDVTDTELKDSELGIVTAVKASDGTPIPEFTLYPLGKYSATCIAQAAFNGTYDDQMVWTSAYHTVVNGDKTYRVKYKMTQRRTRVFRSNGTIVSDTCSCILRADAIYWLTSSPSITWSTGADETVSVQSIDTRVVNALAVVGFPVQVPSIITRGDDPVYFPKRVTGRLAIEASTGTHASYVDDQTGSFSSDALSKYTNVVDSTHLQWDVYILGEKMPGRMVPDMEGRAPNSAYYWKYEGGSGTPQEDNIRYLVYNGSVYTLSTTNNAGSSGIYSWAHCDEGIPLMVSYPYAGLKIIPVMRGADQGHVISDGPMLYSAYSFKCVAEPYSYMRKVDDFATKTDVASREIDYLVKGDNLVDADLNVYSITNRGEDFVVYKNKKYIYKPSCDWFDIDSSYSVYGNKYTNSTDASYMFRVYDRDSTYYQWLFAPMGTDEKADAYRFMTVQSTKGNTGNFHDALTLIVPTPSIPTPAVTSYASVVSVRYTPTTNFVTRAVLENTISVDELHDKNSTNRVLLADGRICDKAYAYPYEGDTVYVEEVPFVYDESRTERSSWSGYYYTDRYYVNPSYTNYYVQTFTSSRSTTGSPVTSSRWMWKSPTEYTSANEVTVVTSDPVFEGVLGMTSGTVRGIPPSGGSESQGLSVRRPIVKANITVDRFVPKSGIGSGIYPVTCTNTSNNSMGVIRPSYNGSTVIWTWSEN